MNNNPIGIFDSGAGGLTVVREIEKLLPRENIIYYGDTARVPYGNKSKSTIVKFSIENILFLLERKVKVVIVACNTSSALALTYLQQIFSVPIIGVIEAGVKKALETSTNGKIAVIGTRSTISSGAYAKALSKNKKKTKIYTQSCPLFVPLVEEGSLNSPLVKSAIKFYLKTIKAKNVDSIVLGCTHYPLIKSQIAKFLNGTTVIDSAKEVASHARDVLKLNGLKTNRKTKGKTTLYVSDQTQEFRRLAKLFLRRKVAEPRKVNV